MNNPLCENQLREEAPEHPNYKPRHGRGEVLRSWPWDWFVTLTFAHHTHPETRLKQLRDWCSEISRELYERIWHEKPPGEITWVVAIDDQRSKRIALHVLFGELGSARRLYSNDSGFSLDKFRQNRPVARFRHHSR